ncbi:MAG: peptidoglycan DD-metalloendopeptidase family protein [Chloroflexi bacterium]|nr:peptidoglycan DD-metalloendopeptidase family protein [Chloroflexota bacterium]
MLLCNRSMQSATLVMVSALIWSTVLLTARLFDARPVSAAPAGYLLPFGVTDSVRITNGPGEGMHGETCCPSSREALDFAICAVDVLPAAGGQVISAGWAGNPGFGNLVKIKHDDGRISYYAHLENINDNIRAKAEATDPNLKRLSRDTVLGRSGDTGSKGSCHLHFEVRQGDDSTPVRVLDMSGIVGNPDWPLNRTQNPRGFASRVRQDLFIDAYNRNGGSGTLGGPRGDANIMDCPSPRCEGVPHFWANERTLLGARGNIVTQNFNGPDGRYGGSDDSIIVHYEVFDQGRPQGVPVWWVDGAGQSRRDDRAFVVRGGIWNVYAGAGGPNGVSQDPNQPKVSNSCGFPVSDEMDKREGSVTKRISYFRRNPEDANSPLHWIKWDPSRQQIFSDCVPAFPPDPDGKPWYRIFGALSELPTYATSAADLAVDLLEKTAPVWGDAQSEQSVPSGVRHGDVLLSSAPPPTGSSSENGATNPGPVSWQVEFYGDTNLSGRCGSTISESSAYVFRDWGDDAPIGGCPADNWSARYSGRVRLATGRYTFGLQADDWGRIRLNGQTVVDKWQSANQHYEGRDISEGDYDITVEFSDTLGSAKIVAWWWLDSDLPRQDREPNLWFVQYFGVRDPNWWDSIVRFNEATISEAWSRNWSTDNPGWGLSSDRFSARAERTAQFNPGVHQFHIRVDDGGRLWVDNLLLIDQWRDQGPTTYDASINLTAGLHTVKFEYYENGGGALAQVWWDPPGPPNDAFAASTVVDVGSLPATYVVSTTAATSEGNEPLSTGCGSLGRTVWFRTTAAQDSLVTVSTYGSAFDTIVAVFAGTSIGALTPVTCSGGSVDSPQAQLTYEARAGTIYYVQVGGSNGASGQLNVNLAASQLPPAPPESLSIVNPTSNSLTLRWLDASTNETGFRIQRAPASSDVWYEVATVQANSVQYVNTGLEAGTTYQYRALAYNTGGESAFSQVASGTTTFQGLLGDLDGNGKVDIFDYNIMLTNFGRTTCGDVADLNADCKVNIFDYSILLTNFGRSAALTSPANVESALLGLEDSVSEGQPIPYPADIIQKMPSAAAGSSRLLLSPATGTLQPVQTFTVTVQLETGGVPSAGTDAVLLFDPAKVEVVSLTNGTIYPSFARSSDPPGQLSISGLSSLSGPSTASGTLASVTFRVLPTAPAGQTQLRLDFDPNNLQKTNDSNVVWSGASGPEDALAGVVNATFTIGANNAGVQVSRPPNQPPGSNPILTATLTARTGCGPIQHIHFGTVGVPFDNASVSVSSPAGGPSGQKVGFLYTPPVPTTSVSITIQRVVQSGGATVKDIQLHDGCGEWRTFVGGGASAFQ